MPGFLILSIPSLWNDLFWHLFSSSSSRLDYQASQKQPQTEAQAQNLERLGMGAARLGFGADGSKKLLSIPSIPLLTNQPLFPTAQLNKQTKIGLDSDRQQNHHLKHPQILMVPLVLLLLLLSHFYPLYDFGRLFSIHHHPGEAQNRFGNAKSISSSQYFGEEASGPDPYSGIAFVQRERGREERAAEGKGVNINFLSFFFFKSKRR